jgi:hypothetical protein
MTSLTKKVSNGSVVYSRVRCSLRRAIFLGEHGPFEQEYRQRVSRHRGDHEWQQVVPGVRQFQGEHDAGQRRTHHATDHRGKAAHGPETGRDVRQQATFGRAECGRRDGKQTAGQAGNQGESVGGRTGSGRGGYREDRTAAE